MARRTLLRLAGLAGGSAALGGCGMPDEVHPRTDDLLVVTTGADLRVLRPDGSAHLTAPRPMISTMDWSHVAETAATDDRTRLVVRSLPGGQVISEVDLRDRLEAGFLSADGRWVVLSTPGGPGVFGLSKPLGRQRTTLVIAQSGREHARLDLPGNLEPIALSEAGDLLYVVEYLPAGGPNRYGFSVIDVASARSRPLSGDPASNELRGAGYQSVHRPDGSVFTLHTRQREATREVPGGPVRSGTHAVVHKLDPSQGSARSVDLPAPFGLARIGFHGIALSPDGQRLVVADAGTGNAVFLRPDDLAIERITRFADPPPSGKVSIWITDAGELLVGAGTTILAAGSTRRITTPGPVRGVVLSADNDAWMAHPGGLVRYDLDTGREVQRLDVPDLHALHIIANT